jgi:chemotaxis signal transduction protein
MDWPQQIMIFTIAKSLFGFPLANIKKVLNATAQEVYPVEVNLPSLYGYSLIGGEMLPLINIHVLLRKISTEDTRETVVLVTEMEGHTIGLLCDQVNAVITPKSPLVKLPRPLLIEAKDYFAGVFLHASTMVLLFNPMTMFRQGDLKLMADTGQRVQQNLESLKKSKKPPEMELAP